MFTFYSLQKKKKTVRSEEKRALFLELTASSTFPYEFQLAGDTNIRPEVISGEHVTVWRFYLTINQADFFHCSALWRQR